MPFYTAVITNSGFKRFMIIASAVFPLNVSVFAAKTEE